LKLRIKRDKLFERLSSSVLDTGLLDQLKAYKQHGSSTCYDHSISVAKAALYMAMFLPFRFKHEQLVRGALLHDYFLYDWHVTRPEKLHGFSHPFTALTNAKRDFSDITPLEENIIKRHMFPLTPVPPRYRESLLVSLADKYCATKEVFVAIRNKIGSTAFPRYSRAVARALPHTLAYLFAMTIAFLPWT